MVDSEGITFEKFKVQELSLELNTRPDLQTNASIADTFFESAQSNAVNPAIVNLNCNSKKLKDHNQKSPTPTFLIIISRHPIINLTSTLIFIFNSYCM